MTGCSACPGASSCATSPGWAARSPRADPGLTTFGPRAASAGNREDVSCAAVTSRPWLVVVGMACALSCHCPNAPVKEGLKPEGVACAADDECETGLCEALPGGAELCMRKC